MFHTIEPALDGVWLSIGNFEKETGDTIKILTLVYGVGLYINHLTTSKDSIFRMDADMNDNYMFFYRLFAVVLKIIIHINTYFQNINAEIL